MDSMNSIRRENGTLFSLDELVEEANRLLPRYLSEQVSDASVRSEVNARLVRHLTTIGVLNEALREGREARYDNQHLLQLLAARRLMSERHNTSTIRPLLEDADEAALQALLERGAQVTVQHSPLAPEEAVSNAALNFLQSVRSRGSKSLAAPFPPSALSASAPQQSPTLPGEPTPEVEETITRWQRYEVRPGLELHVREDFRPPPTPHEREGVLDTIVGLLKRLPPDRKRRKS